MVSRAARATVAWLFLVGQMAISGTAWACPYCASGGVSKQVAVLMMGVIILPFVLSGLVLRAVLRTSSDLELKESSRPAGG